jgi:LytS/YehU family sensor histidine kinase
MNHSKEILYWSVQVLFWSFLNALTFIEYWQGGPKYNNLFWQTLIHLSIHALIGVFCSHGIKKYLIKKSFLNNIKVLSVFKSIGIIIFYIVLFYNLITHLPKIGYALIKLIFDIGSNNMYSEIYERIIFNRNINILLIWITCFIALKIIIEIFRNGQERLVLKANLKEAKLNALRGQINPHFIFNSLNNIRGLMLEDVSKAREMITRLSDMLRYSLSKSEADKIALNDELEMIDNYLAISKIQLEERLKFEKNILLDTDHILIPPMIIQMLVENGMKHGITQLKKGGMINLNIKNELNNLIIEVINSGKLKLRSDSTKLGIQNIKQRLSLQYNNNATFNLKEKNNCVIATIQIPLS